MKKQTLKCSCCGGWAGKWMQWPNRDKGYGICASCVRWMQDVRKKDAETFRDCYGEPGVHYEAQEQTQCP